MNHLTTLILSGGVLIYPLFFCAFIALIICIERVIYWVKLKLTYNTNEVELVYTLIAHRQLDEAQKIFEQSKDPSLIILKHCIASKGRIHSQILQSLAQQKLDRSKKYMRSLETITTVSPLLGILGTILGIITSVTELGAKSSNTLDSQTMIAGLSQALITTAIGLLISIFCLVLYGYFMGYLEDLKAKFERDLSAFESLGTQ